MQNCHCQTCHAKQRYLVDFVFHNFKQSILYVAVRRGGGGYKQSGPWTMNIGLVRSMHSPVNLAVSKKKKSDTHGSFILMKTLHVKNDTRTQTKPRNSKRNLLSLDMPTAFDLSRIMKPNPPIENKKLDARPSMMY